MVICLERGADLHMAQLMPLPLTVSCFSKIQIGLTFLVPAHPDSPGKRAIKRVCVCVCTLFCSQKDLELFLEHTRAKFVGFHVKNDTQSLAGLPQPIHEGVKVLNQVSS